MHIRKRVLGTVLSVMMAFSAVSVGVTALPTDAYAADAATQGQFGDLTWSVSEDHILTISGNGAMQNKELSGF